MKKELLDEYMAAKWKSPEDIRGFTAAAGTVSADDITAMLDVLMSRKSVQGSAEHGHRLRIFSELASKVVDKRLFEPYLRALKTEDRHLRTVLAGLFINAQNSALYPKLCELMKSPDSGLRRTAGQILLKLGDKTVLRVLGTLFRERTFAGKVEAIDLAGAMPSHQAAEFFKVVLDTGAPAEKVRAIRHLGSPAFIESSPKTVASVVQPAFRETDESVVAEAISVFSRVCTEDEYFSMPGAFLYETNLRLVRAAVEGLRYFTSGRVMAVLERKLYTGPAPVRMTVLDTIEAIGTSAVKKPLLKALEHKQGPVRSRAGEVLTKLTKTGKIEAADAVIWLLRSSSSDVRRMAADVVAGMAGRQEELWHEVMAHLRNEDWWIRQRMINALIETAGAELVPHLVAYLSDPSDIIRRFAIEVLSRLKSAAALPTLLDTAAADRDWWVREMAIFALAGISDGRVVPHLLEIANREPLYQVAVLEALRLIGDGSAAGQATGFLASDNQDVRFAALKLIESFNNPAYGEHVLPLTKDPDVKVNHLAREIAQKWNLNYEDPAESARTSLSVLDRMLIALHKASGDDLILLPGHTPYLKRHGRIIPLSKTELSLQQLQSIAKPLLTGQQHEDLTNLRDADFSYVVKSEGIRFRVNLFQSRTGVSMVFRIIKGHMWRLEDLGLPAIAQTFGDFKNGLVLVGGPTGSGKSTTLASIIDYINRTSKRHVISIEDPIEVVHKSGLGLVNQREVGVHTPSFTHALRMTLREDPDVILLGELRDLPTIQFAVTAAETGHLVFGTVHTVAADSSIDRLINAYPPEAQEQVRSMLADSLRAVLCQYLIPHKEINERVLACEVMINTYAISNLIRKGKTFQIPSVIVTSREHQMQMMDTSLMDLYKQGRISAEEAYLKARDKSEFEELVGIKKERRDAAAGSPQKGPEQGKASWQG